MELYHTLLHKIAMALPDNCIYLHILPVLRKLSLQFLDHLWIIKEPRRFDVQLVLKYLYSLKYPIAT